MGNKNGKTIQPWNVIILFAGFLSALAACQKLSTLINEEEIPVTGVNLNKTQISILVGASEQLVATVTPQDATNQKVSWTSSNTSVASVTSSGLVTGNATGTSDIVVTTQQNGFQATCKVTVTEAPSGSTVAAPIFMPNGGTYSDSQIVILKGETAGVSFKYTTDGSDPRTSPTAIEGDSVFVTMPMTIKAYAYSGSASSEVSTSSAYTITSGIVFVSSTGDDSHQGTIKFPKKTIASGIALADSLFATGEVRVAEGVYPISSQIDLKDGISLYGSYNKEGFSDRNLSIAVTTIQDVRTSGECTAIAGNGIGNATVFDGFTVKGANTGSGSSICMSISNSSLSIRNNTIVCGTATGYSVGISMSTVSSIISNNVIYGGNAGNRNIKIAMTQGSNPKIYNNTLIADTGTPRRYVIQLREDGGGYCHPTLKNNLFVDFASDVGSAYYGVYHMDSGSGHYPYAYTTNLFYVAPVASGDGAYVYYSGGNSNNINFDNYTTKPAFIYPSGSQILTYNDPAWRNLVDQDPLFLNPASGDFHLQSSSPARNTGTDLSAEIPPSDRDGKSRTAPWSIGAYELD